MNVVRLGDTVLPVEKRTILCGAGLVGWGPDSPYPATIVSIEGDEVVCRSEPRTFADKLYSGHSTFRTNIAGLRKVES